jgi:hypothetical protein
MSATSEPQVPGPGCRCPAPSAVASNHAQRGAAVLSAGALAGLSLVMWRSFIIGTPLAFCRITPCRRTHLARQSGRVISFSAFVATVNRRRYDIPATGPLAQIDGAAPLATEWKLRLSSKHQFTADGATQA